MNSPSVPGKNVPSTDTLHRWIRLTQRLAVAALILSIGLVGFNVYKVYSLRANAKNLQAELDKKQVAMQELDQKIADKERQLEELEQSYAKALTIANQPSESLSVFDEIKPRARAVRVTGPEGSNGNQIYDFSLWLDAPAATRRKIAKVTYNFNHPTFRKKQVDSTDPSNGFEVGYRGWGALRLVTIDVQLKNGTVRPIYFDMLKALGWESG